MNIDMDERVLSEYFRKSYMSADGLWFVKVEEDLGFDKALELDVKVWEVLPKIQARHVRKLLDIQGNGIGPFFEAITVKLEGEGYDYTMDEEDRELRFKGCPWHEIMISSGREHLSDKVGAVICQTELGTWAREFGLEAAMEDRFCAGAEECVLRLR